MIRLPPDMEFHIHPGGRTSTVVDLYLRAEKVSWLIVNHLVVRVGGARLRAGGIGGVGTAEAHRMKGYSSLCMRKSIEVMEEKGLHLGYLFGIPNYYHRWGFTQAIPEPRLTLSTRAAASVKAPAGFRIVPFDLARHGRDVLAIYDDNERLRSMSVVRPKPGKWRGFWLGSGWFRRTESFVVLRGRRIAGYGVNDRNRNSMVVSEVGWRDPAAFPAITAEFAFRARRRRVKDITLHLPPDHAYARYLRRIGVDALVHWWRNGDGMARIMLLEGTFRDCASELGRRLRNSALARARFAVRIRCEMGEVRLAAANGRVAVRPGKTGLRATIPQGILCQLLTGYRTVADAITEPGVRIPPAAVAPLSALFPPAFPYCLPADRF